jgi:hypothetical protein
MAVPTSADLAQVLALLREGKVQEADTLVAEHEVALADAEREARGEPKEPPPPREPEAIAYDIMHALASHMGMPPRVQRLFAEFDASLAKK